MALPPIATESRRVQRPGVAGSQLGHLGVGSAAIGRAEDVDRATGAGLGGRDHDGGAVDRHGAAEVFPRRGVRGVSLATSTCVAPPSLVRKT